MSIQTWTCQLCGEPCSRVAVRGQRPKWCGAACAGQAAWARTLARLSPRTCARCRVTYDPSDPAQVYCSVGCASKEKWAEKRSKKPSKAKYEPLDQRSPLRKAYEDGCGSDVLALLRGMSHRDADGCWTWDGPSKDGYPIASIGRRIYAHRLSIEASRGAKLGSQHAHHVCANTMCVNPDHLVPVTHAANAAEMLARRAYVARIRELEDALFDIAPGHPLLALLPVA